MGSRTSLLLIGIGTSGVRIACGIQRAFGDALNFIAVDTDASLASECADHFVLYGGDRLSGRGAGGDVVAARLAAEDSAALIDPYVEGVRLAVIVTSLGGGTGGGATLETLKHLARFGIHTIVFATTPFSFEGEERHRNARGVMPMIQDAANATFFLPLDKLVEGEDNMEAAMRRAIDTVASGVTLFWRLVAKPGYIRLDADRICHLMARAGRGRFAAVTVQGTDRASEAVERLTQSAVLSTACGPVSTILCGVLGGEDLRLSELARISDGFRSAFGENIPIELATVNDEATFCGRLSVVAMLFEGSVSEAPVQAPGVIASRKKTPRKTKNPLAIGPTGRGRFNNAEPTEWHGEDLDIPTYVRRNIILEY